MLHAKKATLNWIWTSAYVFCADIMLLLNQYKNNANKKRKTPQYQQKEKHK